MTTTTNSRLAVLETEHKQMTNDIAEIKDTLKAQDIKLEQIKTLITTNFVTQTEYQAYKQSTIRALENAKISNEHDVTYAKKTNMLSTVGYVLATAIVTAMAYWIVAGLVHKS